MAYDPCKTSAIGKVAYLLAEGHRVVSRSGPPWRRVWTFPPSARADAVRYDDGTAKVSPRAFLRCLRDIKHELHADDEAAA